MEAHNSKCFGWKMRPVGTCLCSNDFVEKTRFCDVHFAWDIYHTISLTESPIEQCHPFRADTGVWTEAPEGASQEPVGISTKPILMTASWSDRIRTTALRGLDPEGDVDMTTVIIVFKNACYECECNQGKRNVRSAQR